MPRFKEGDKVLIVSMDEKGEVFGHVGRLPMVLPGENEQQVQYFYSVQLDRNAEILENIVESDLSPA